MPVGSLYASHVSQYIHSRSRLLGHLGSHLLRTDTDSGEFQLKPHTMIVSYDFHALVQDPLGDDHGSQGRDRASPELSALRAS